MKLFKQLTSATLALTLAAGATAASIPAKADAANGQIIYDTVLNEWQQRINTEMAKFPHLAYWNNKQTGVKSENTYSEYTSDERYRSYLTQEKVKGLDYDSKFFCRKAYYPNWEKTEEIETNNGECVGFARKLSNDIWGPVVLIRHKIKNSYNDTNNISNEELYDMDYTPQIGDVVRLDYKVSTSKGEKNPGHSIFITNIDSNGKITFAECNGEMNDCQIRWGRDRYYHALNWEAVDLPDQNGRPVNMILFTGNKNSQVTVTKDFFLEHASYYERPGIAGDLNFDGKLNSNDAEIFENTVVYNGKTSGSDKAPLSFYDVNGDGYVNNEDLNSLRYGRPERRLVKLSEGNVNCKWKSIGNVNGFRFSDGCYYVKNDIGGVSWIGAVDSELTSVSVPSRVYYSNDNCWYTVNEIGYYSQYNNSGNRGPSCTNNCGIKTLTIPDTVKRIHEYTFSNGALTTLKFAGNNSQLEEIDKSAFVNCKSLRNLDLRPAKNLKVIGANVFEGCDNLAYIDLPYTKQDLTFGTFRNGFDGQSIFGSNKSRPTTLYINDENYNLTSSSTLQPLIFGNNDYAYLKNNKVRVYGKVFKAKYRNNNNYISELGQRGTSNGYLYVN